MVLVTKLYHTGLWLSCVVPPTVEGYHANTMDVGAAHGPRPGLHSTSADSVQHVAEMVDGSSGGSRSRGPGSSRTAKYVDQSKGCMNNGILVKGSIRCLLEVQK